MTGTNDFMAEINKRYNDLAEKKCNLSCGDAFEHSNPRNGEICVDIGSGRGEDVVKLAIQVGEKGLVYGIDGSKNMIEKAMKKAEKLNIENVRFILSQFEKIDLPDESADLVISNCTINHSSNKNAVWNEIYRILKGGGRFVVSDIFSMEKVPDQYAQDPKLVAQCWAGAVTKDIYLETLDKIGFIDISILEQSLPYQKEKIKISSFTICGWKPLDKSK